MSAPLNDYERYLELADREACDEALTAEECGFCRSFERDHPELCPDLRVYSELAQLNTAPNAASRALVDRTLAQIEAEDAARASEDVRRLRKRRLPGFVPGFAIMVAAAAFALGSGYALIRSNSNSELHDGPATSRALARAELVYTSGVVKISDANGTPGRTLLSEGSVVETQSGAACVLIDSDINVCLAANSRMLLRTLAGPARVVSLEAGKLATRLATQPEGMSLSIVADGVASTAIGTAFSVERQAKRGTVTTTVLHGKVRVGRASKVILVSAHERAVTRSHGPATSPTITSVRRTEEAPSWALLGPTVLWHDPVAATLDVSGEPVGAEAWLDDQWLGVTPVSSLIPAGEHHLSVRRHNRELLSRDLYVHAGDSQNVRYEHADQQQAGRDDSDVRGYAHNTGHNARRARARERSRASERATRESDETTPSNVEHESDSGLGLRQARQAIRAGQFRAAAAIYEQLIEGGATPEEASTAMVSLGQLRLNQLGDPKGALAPLNAYLRRGGPLAVEARVARIEALRRLNRSYEEASAIRDFLRLHPRSFEVKRLQTRLQTLQAKTIR